MNAAWNRQDFTLLLLAACAKYGTAPDTDWDVEMTPVDFAARGHRQADPASGFCHRQDSSHHQRQAASGQVRKGGTTAEGGWGIL